MVTSNFLLLLIVFLNAGKALQYLIFKEGALPSENQLKCAYKEWPPFCEFMNIVYKDDKKAMDLMTEYTFKVVKEGISDVMQAILKALKVEQKPDLLVALLNVLDLQNSALFQLIVSCAGPKNGTTACKEGLGLLTVAVQDLVYVIGELAGEGQKAKIEAAKVTFKNSVNETILEKGSSGTGDYPMQVHGFGTAVSAVFESSAQ